MLLPYMIKIQVILTLLLLTSQVNPMLFTPTDFNVYPAVCDDSNKYAPCSCTFTMTEIKINTHQVEFLEFVCNEKRNKKRTKKGKIPPGYKCTQLGADTTLFKDADGNPIDPIGIHYRAGCEMRCTNRNCKRNLSKGKLRGVRGITVKTL